MHLKIRSPSIFVTDDDDDRDYTVLKRGREEK